MKYLKKFETQSDYAEALDNLILPNVSLVNENKKVYCNDSTQPQPTQDYVEIAGVKWATMNVGANSVTDYGRYFQWADTEGDVLTQDKQFTKNFDWSTCPYTQSGGSGSGSGSGSVTMLKYNSNDGKTRLEAIDDAATATLGVNWRMPTSEEFDSLIQNTTQTFVEDYEGSDVDGFLFTSKNDTNKKLFFPFGGNASQYYVQYVGEGYYWTSDFDTTDDERAHCVWLYSYDVQKNPYERCYGLTIRPVYDEGYGLRNNNE